MPEDEEDFSGLLEPGDSDDGQEDEVLPDDGADDADEVDDAQDDLDADTNVLADVATDLPRYNNQSLPVQSVLTDAERQRINEDYGDGIADLIADVANRQAQAVLYNHQRMQQMMPPVAQDPEFRSHFGDPGRFLKDIPQEMHGTPEAAHLCVQSAIVEAVGNAPDAKTQAALMRKAADLIEGPSIPPKNPATPRPRGSQPLAAQPTRQTGAAPIPVRRGADDDVSRWSKTLGVKLDPEDVRLLKGRR